MYQKLFELLKTKGVQFDKGLSVKEIDIIEKEYHINFTDELKQMYKVALPISHGFYNWRDQSINNVAMIKNVMKSPMFEVLDEIDDVEWCEKWGQEPKEKSERQYIIKELLSEAPKLIPLRGHRYLASLNDEPNPVLSICGLDIIYYGECLSSYLEIEFKLKSRSNMKYENINSVPFWSDLL